jgi:hypothetical protein
MTVPYIAAAAIAFGALALRSGYVVAAALRRPTLSASVRAYESSKWAFIAVLGLFSALFLIRVIPTYFDLLALFILDLAGWRLTARFAIRRRDALAGASVLDIQL